MQRIAASRRHRPWQRSLLVVALALALPALRALVVPSDAAAQPATFFDRGLRWVGLSPRCAGSTDWAAERVFQNPAALWPGAADVCLYKWSRPGTAPNRRHVADLFLGSGATSLIEDVPVVEPMQSIAWSSEELAFYAGLRAALLGHVGTAALLPAMPPAPRTRIAVLDTSPDAAHGAIRVGTSRHGDTLAHLIEDLVCEPPGNGTARRCAAEVTSVLALPWLQSGVRSTDGGRTGTLVDLARAVERAVQRWELDRAAGGPRQLILNLSVGWEHQPSIADCPPSPSSAVELPALLVQRVLQYATGRGALVLAAAGNDAGGPTPRSGLTCPGAYQQLPSTAAPRPLVLAASGVDYADRPLVGARPLGRTSFAALGFGGMAWGGADQAPPALVGSSVATAVVASVAALVWAHQPLWGAEAVSRAVYDGGVVVPGPAADACPLAYACTPRRASTCGALLAAGASLSCTPAAAQATSSPPLPAQLTALIAALPGPAQPAQAVYLEPSPSLLPRFLAPSAQVAPWTFPMPIQATCPTCYAGMSTPGEGAHVALRNLGKTLYHPMVVVQFDPDAPPPSGTQGAIRLAETLPAGATIEVALPESWTLQSAYLTAFEDAALTRSMTEQLFVHRE